ncbi:MAG: hypothetical protein ACM3PY_15755 [Omnitrophica WOR_2 bacterium]
MLRKKATVPSGVLLIAGFYVFGAIVLLAFLFINPAQTSSIIAQRHGLPASTGSWILPIIAGLALLIAYGLVSLSRWGYVLTILYLIYFGSVNWFISSIRADPLNFGNLVWSFLVILYLIIVRKQFSVEGSAIRSS